MRKFQGFISTGIVGADRIVVFEIEDDDATQEEIDEYAREVVFNYVEWGYVEC